MTGCLRKKKWGGKNSSTTFAPPLQRRAQEIAELSVRVADKEKEIITVRKENMQAENRMKKSKDILEAQIKTIVEAGGVSEEVCNLTAKVYASFIKEEDLIKDENGSIKIKKDSFLKEVKFESLNPGQRERFEYMVNLVVDNLPSEGKP